MTDQIILVVAFGFAFFSIWLSYKVWRLGNELGQRETSEDEKLELYVEPEIEVEVSPDIDVEFNIAQALDETDQEIRRIQLLVDRLAASDIYSPTVTRLSESLDAQRTLVENLSGIERARSASDRYR
jgi:hypothetical protein